ncbi:MAG: amino acid ABC transporter substrate-binding protein [Deltaproteobacteria bacterium]|nr:amino acid ABC transporter substrate-binding protein [Deltaproteobacteria bacterium]
MRKKFKFLAVCLGLMCFTVFVLSGHLTSVAQAEKKPLKIGFSMGLSGGLAAAGKAALLSLKICAEDFNKKGGVLGRPVELVYYDDHSKPADVPAIYTKLISVDKVDFVIGPYGTALIAPAMPIVMQNKMAFITLFGLAINEKFNYPYYFQIMAAGPEPYIGWSDGFFDVAAEQTPKPKTVALLAVDNEYGLNGQIGARKNAEKHGFKVVYEKRYPPGTVDFTPIMRAIKAKKPDIVWISSYPPGTVGTLKAAKEINLSPKMIGGGLVGSQFTSIQKNFGPAMNGIVFYTFWAPSPTLKFPGVEAFLAKYQKEAKKQGLDPLGFYLPPPAYAYLQVLLQSIEATKSTDQKTVGEYMRKAWFETVLGKIRFAPNGEWWQSRVLQVQLNGIKGHNVSEFADPANWTVLAPKKWANGKFVYPFPGWK